VVALKKPSSRVNPRARESTRTNSPGLSSPAPARFPTRYCAGKLWRRFPALQTFDAGRLIEDAVFDRDKRISRLADFDGSNSGLSALVPQVHESAMGQLQVTGPIFRRADLMAVADDGAGFLARPAIFQRSLPDRTMSSLSVSVWPGSTAGGAADRNGCRYCETCDCEEDENGFH